MSRLILHVGTHKTGTTSIQHALEANRAWLSDRGFTYAKFDDCRVSHNGFANRLAETEEGELPDLRKELLGNVVDGRALVVSAEKFSARIVGEQHWHQFDGPDYWCRKRAYLARLRELVQDFDEVDVLLCFRRQDRYAESLYATSLQRDRFRGSFEEFRERCAPIFDYRAQLLEFRKLFDNVRIASFEHLKPNLVPAFLEWAGIPFPPGATERKKVTPDLRMIYWLYASGGADDSKTHDLRVKFCKGADIDGLFPGAARTTLWRSMDERLRFLGQCKDPEGVTVAGPVAPHGEEGAFLDAPALLRVDNAFQEWCYALRNLKRGRDLRQAEG